ncbi:hypothetical protein BT96DRAFT_1003053 [Gymnopus androsaceus JB14]|uniref:Uncharacterized protein n=1 Tax=Gymnopus androsaceus JB14 TaxID=1447944 RepID=A0A6A4GX83_9AGAR|nr:hypothetical protein BT96DRAFT_1003053 [Gymnopus androsaceus JB14]
MSTQTHSKATTSADKNPRRTLPPKYRALSGYSLSSDDFQTFVISIAPSAINAGSPIAYVLHYDRWRRNLPQDVPREQVPSVICLFRPGDKEQGEPSHLFFPTWSAPYQNREQLTQPDFCIPNGLDVARLEEFARMVEDKCGGKLDKTALKFECIKDLHPYYK